MLAHIVLRALALLWLLGGVSLLTATFWIGTTAYADFSQQLLGWVHKPDWQTYFQTRVLPPARYALLPWLLSIATLCWGTASFFLWQSRQWLLALSRELADTYRAAGLQRWAAFSPQERWVLAGLLTCCLLRSIYYAGRYALQYDEAWTYNHFTANGPLVAFLSPNNNHIVYTLLACLTDLLPLEGAYSLRLPVMLGSLALLGSAALWWRARWSWGWASLALVWLAFCPGVSLYSLLARGYIFQMGCSFWAIAATVYLVQTPVQARFARTRRAAWGIWGVSLVLGLWCVPTHAYLCMVLSGWLGLYSLRQGQSWTWIVANTAVLGSTALLYAPYLLTNGGATLLAAAGSEAPRGDAFWAYQDKVTDWLLLGAGRGTPVYGVLLVLVGGLLVGAWRQWRTRALEAEPLVIASLLLLPTGLNLLTGIQPPYRIWCFLSIPLAWGMGWLGNQSRWKWHPLMLGGVALLLTVGQLWRMEQHYALQWSAQLDHSIKDIATRLMEQDIKEIYLFTHYDKPLLEYYYQRAQRPLTLYLAAPNSQSHAYFKRKPLYPAVLWNPSAQRLSPQEHAWINKHYPYAFYRDDRINIHFSQPKKQ